MTSPKPFHESLRGVPSRSITSDLRPLPTFQGGRIDFGYERKRTRPSRIARKFRIACQNSFYTVGGVDNPGDVCVISGRYHFDLGSAGATTWADFCNKSQAEIENNLRNVFLPAAPTVSADTRGVIVIDLETVGTQGIEGHFSHPNHLWKETDADKALVITAWKRRIAATRTVFPHARIGMYALPRSGNIGDGGLNIGDGHWADRIGALVQAGTAAGYNGVGGAYDGLDLLIPITYQIYGPNDTAQKWGGTRARVVECMGGMVRIKKSDGSSIPAIPFLSTCVFGSTSVDDGVLLTELNTADPLGSTWGVHFPLFVEYGVKEVAVWNGLNSRFAVAGANGIVETTTPLSTLVSASGRQWSTWH